MTSATATDFRNVSSFEELDALLKARFLLTAERDKWAPLTGIYAQVVTAQYRSNLQAAFADHSRLVSKPPRALPAGGGHIAYVEFSHYVLSSDFLDEFADSGVFFLLPFQGSEYEGEPSGGFYIGLFDTDFPHLAVMRQLQGKDRTYRRFKEAKDV